MSAAPPEGESTLRARWVAVALVGAAGGVLLAARSYLASSGAPFGDDHSAHMTLMRHLAALFRAGETDLWWPQNNLGLPLFLTYQPLPGLTSGALAALLDGLVDPIRLFKATIVGPWALMPASWYLGGRWLGLDRSRALLLGLLTLAPRDAEDVGLTFTASAYGGLYTQAWGMLLLPLGLGAFRRHVVDRAMPLPPAAVLFAVVGASHLFLGMWLGLATLTMALVWPGDRRSRLVRTAVLYGVVLALLSPWIGPLLLHRDLSGGLPWSNPTYAGWPLTKIVKSLMGGELFDHERFPWLTLLVLGGLWHTVRWRREPRARWLLALGALNGFLFLGRTNLGALYDAIPMHADVNVMRYVVGLHAIGLLMAADAGVHHGCRLARRVGGWLPEALAGRRTAVATGVLAALAVAAYATDRYAHVARTLKSFPHYANDLQAVADHLSRDAQHRFAVDAALGTTSHFHRDLLPALAAPDGDGTGESPGPGPTSRPQLQSYALGYHATPSTYYAEYIRYDETWGRLFDVNAYVARGTPSPEVPVDRLETDLEAGRYRVLSFPGEESWGWFGFVRTPVTLHGSVRAVRPAVRELAVPLFEHGLLPRLGRRSGDVPRLEADGETRRWGEVEVDALVDRLAEQHPGRPMRSEVRSSSHGPTWYEARVEVADDAERLLLKTNYFPYWHATVDGEEVPIEHVAPNFMAVDVPKGRHRVRFEYRNPVAQKVGAGLAALVALLWPAWVLLRRRRRRDDGEPPASSGPAEQPGDEGSPEAATDPPPSPPDP